MNRVKSPSKLSENSSTQSLKERLASERSQSDASQSNTKSKSATNSNIPRLNVIPNTPSQETNYEKNDSSSNSSSDIKNWYKEENLKDASAEK